MCPGLWERWFFWSWGLLLWFIVGNAGDTPPIQQPKCTDFQNADLLRGTSLRVQFLLFTPSDPSCGKLVEESRDLQNSGFNVTLGTKLLIHGFRALGTKPSWIEKFISALLRAADTNVIAVDWVYGSTAVYFSAVENVVKLGLEISRFLSKLLVLGVSESSIHIIGVSLGAHVGGMVGHFYKGQLGQITGLDPAGPEYTRASLEERLDAGDALFVEAIHTDTDNLGIRIPVGHVDYFVNGGQDQPGCPTFIHAGYSYLICDHMRAVHLYISALENSCSLMAFPCASYKAFLAGRCLDCFNPFLLSCPRIGLVEQDGVKIEPLPKEVSVYLLTTSEAPYCEFGKLDACLSNVMPERIHGYVLGTKWVTRINCRRFTYISFLDNPALRVLGILASVLSLVANSMSPEGPQGKVKDCFSSYAPITKGVCEMLQGQVHHSLVEFYLQKPRNKDTNIVVTFFSSNVTSSAQITIPRQQLQGRGVLAHPDPQCQVHQVNLKFQASHWVWKKDRTTIVGKFCTAPLPVNDNKKTVCLPEPVNLQPGVTVCRDLKITCA